MSANTLAIAAYLVDCADRAGVSPDGQTQAWGPVNSYCAADRAHRREKKRKLRRHGVKVARKCWVMCVEPQAITVPAWALDLAESRLDSNAQRIWVRGRSNWLVRRLIALDAAAGGMSRITQIEYRVCQVCKRLLLSVEAADRRELDESFVGGQWIPCNGECGTTQEAA